MIVPDMIVPDCERKIINYTYMSTNLKKRGPLTKFGGSSGGSL